MIAMHAMDEIDLLLIGAGPSNIALAVALEEGAPVPGLARVVMLEAGDAISWHRGMMFAEAQSQVSFLKDLVTLRDPTSRFSFLNYLHCTGRLEDFVNLLTFFPYRRELAGYLQWCGTQLRRVEVRYDSAVDAVVPVLDGAGRIARWSVRCRNGQTFLARRLAYGAGRDPHVPEPFQPFLGKGVVHASRFLEHAEAAAGAMPDSIVVVGAAQSSAEVYAECLRRFPQARVRLLMRSVGLLPYGGSKFTNELYSNDFVDEFYASPPDVRACLLDEMRQSNYSGVTPAMLETLFRFHYLQRLDGCARATMHAHAEIVALSAVEGRLAMRWNDRRREQQHEELVDLIVLGTGYRNALPSLLKSTLESLGMEDVEVSRDYRAALPCTDGASLHLLGINETTHGISDTLLSVVGARARRVLADLRDGGDAKNSAQARMAADHALAA